MVFCSDSLVEQVWNKAQIVPGYNMSIWRQDFAGAWIRRDQYGIQSSFGWVIGHLLPQSRGGADELLNLVPLHWRNNETKGNDELEFQTSITSKGNRNIERRRQWIVNQ